MPYPLINGKATGGEDPPPPAREGLHGAAPSILLGTTVNDLVAVVTYYGMSWLLLIQVFSFT